MSGPIVATAVDGSVWIQASPETARDLADAWAAAYSADAELDASHPRWHDDVVAIVRAAAYAEIQSGNGPVAVLVPLFGSAS